MGIVLHFPKPRQGPAFKNSSNECQSQLGKIGFVRETNATKRGGGLHHSKKNNERERLQQNRKGSKMKCAFTHALRRKKQKTEKKKRPKKNGHSRIVRWLCFRLFIFSVKKREKKKFDPQRPFASAPTMTWCPSTTDRRKLENEDKKSDLIGHIFVFVILKKTDGQRD